MLGIRCTGGDRTADAARITRSALSRRGVVLASRCDNYLLVLQRPNFISAPMFITAKGYPRLRKNLLNADNSVEERRLSAAYTSRTTMGFSPWPVRSRVLLQQRRRPVRFLDSPVEFPILPRKVTAFR
jgi:hypothetical protein